MIDRVQDRDSLIQEGCRLLADSRGYTCAFIVLTDQNDRPVSWAEAGMGAHFDPLVDALVRGELPYCCHAPIEKEVLVVEDRQNMCAECPSGLRHARSVSLCAQLAHDGIDYGYLVAVADHKEPGIENSGDAG